MAATAAAATSTNGSSSNSIGGTTGYPITTTPFTPKQQQALMRLNGNAAMSQDTTMAAQQYQYAMMMQAQAAAYHQHQQQQQRQASTITMAAGPPGHPRGAHQQQHYSPQYASAASTIPALPWHPAGRSITSSMENHHAMQLQLQLQRQQHHHHHQAQAQAHFQYQNSVLYPPSSAGSPSSSQSHIFPSGSQQQYHFVGGEPSNAYRLVTQSQLAQLQNTPIPSSAPTPAVPSSAALRSATTPSASVFHASTSGAGGSSVGGGSTASPVKVHEKASSASFSSVENTMQVEDPSDSQRTNSNASTELNPPPAAAAQDHAQMTRPTMHATGINTTVGGKSTTSTSSPRQGGSSTSSPPSATKLNGQKQALGPNGDSNGNGHRATNKTPPLQLEDTLRNGSTSSLTMSDRQEGISIPSSVEPFTPTSAPTLDDQQRDNTVKSAIITSPSSSQSHPNRQSQPANVIPNSQTATLTFPSGSISGNTTQAPTSLTSPNSTMPRMNHQRSHKNGNGAVTSVSEEGDKTIQPTSADLSANESGEKRKLSDRRPTLTVDTSFTAPNSAATASVRQQPSAPHQVPPHQQQQLSRQASNQQCQQQVYQQQQQQQQMSLQTQLQPAMYEVANVMHNQQMPIYTLQVAPPPMATAYK